MYYIFFIHCCVDGHSRCFCVLAIVNRATLLVVHELLIEVAFLVVEHRL